jgi:hypothetical protein
MKILSIILIIIGFAISGICSLVILYATHIAMNTTQDSASSLANIAWGLGTAYLASIANIVGFAILGLGVLLNIIGLFSGRKQQQAAS